MGYLTKLLRRSVLFGVSISTCRSDLLEKQNDSIEEGTPGNAAVKVAASKDPPLFDDPSTPKTFLLYASSLFDIIDILNVTVNLVFLSRLFREEISDVRLYGGILLAGLVLGRIVGFRGTSEMFKHGIRWNPFWVEPRQDRAVHKQRTFNVIYSVLFTEVAVFFFEDFPTLVAYELWKVMTFPPRPLETIDKVNVALSATALLVLVILLFLALVVSLITLLKNDYRTWSQSEKVFNLSKIVVFWVCFGFLFYVVMKTFSAAIDVVWKKNKDFPSNKILGIEICDYDSNGTESGTCDERIFLARVAWAWTTATIFASYLFFRPPLATGESPNQQYKRGDSIENPSITDGETQHDAN